MPEIQEDGNLQFQCSLSIDAYGQSISEVYNLVNTNSWGNARNIGVYIARWRAAILGRGGIIRSGRVSEIGRARKSKAVFTNPLQGTFGVHFGGTGFKEKAAQMHTLGTSVRMRFETEYGDHYTRQILGPVDGYVNNYQWNSNVIPHDEFHLGDFRAGFGDGSNIPLPKQELWNFAAAGAQTRPAASRGWYSYEEAWQMYLRILFSFTKYRLPTVNDQGAITGYTSVPWYNIAYRGISGKNPGAA